MLQKYAKYIIRGKAIIPNTITVIKSHAFENCLTLSSVIIPEGVKEIDYMAFCNCRNLRTIVLPDSLIKIAPFAFENCYKLSKINLPDGLVDIGIGVFTNNTGLTSIKLPKSVIRIGVVAFLRCRSLTSIIIPEGVKTIYEKTFAGCEALKRIKIPKSIKRIGAGAFTDCVELVSINLPDGLVEIDGSAFSGCTKLESIKIPDSVHYIGPFAFGSCSRLTTLEISSNTHVHINAFSGCDNLSTIFLNSLFSRDSYTVLNSITYDKKKSTISLHVPRDERKWLLGYWGSPYFSQFKELKNDIMSEEVCHNSGKKTDVSFMAFNHNVIKPTFVFFDTETTGLPLKPKAPMDDLNNWPRLVQLSWIVSDEDGNVVETSDNIIIPSGFSIPSSASVVHGITEEIARRKGKRLIDVLSSFYDIVKSATGLVGHNIGFDINVVGAEMVRLGFNNIFAWKPYYDTMKQTVDYCAIPGSYGYRYPKLQELYKKLFGRNFDNAHNALSDVTATKECFFELNKGYSLEEQVDEWPSWK